MSVLVTLLHRELLTPKGHYVVLCYVCVLIIFLVDAQRGILKDL